MRNVAIGVSKKVYKEFVKGRPLLRGVDPELTGLDKRVSSYVWSLASLVLCWSYSDYEIAYLPIMIFKGE